MSDKVVKKQIYLYFNIIYGHIQNLRFKIVNVEFGIYLFFSTKSKIGSY